MVIKIYDVCNDYSLELSTTINKGTVGIAENTMRSHGCKVFHYIPDIKNPSAINGYNEHHEIIYRAEITI